MQQTYLNLSFIFVSDLEACKNSGYFIWNCICCEIPKSSRIPKTSTKVGYYERFSESSKRDHSSTSDSNLRRIQETL